MLTYKFIARVKLFFNTIGFFPEIKINLEELEKKFVNATSKCIYIGDANDLIVEYVFVLKSIKKVDKLLQSRKKEEFIFADPDIKMDVEFCELEEAYGNTIFTTVISKKKDKVNFFTCDEGEIFEVIRNRKILSIYSDSEYIMKHKLNNIEIKIDNRLLIKLSMDEDFKIISKNNNTIYQIINNEGYYKVENTNINRANEENLAAIIQTDLADEKSDFVSVLVEPFEEDDELLLLIGFSALLLVQDFFEIQHTNLMRMRAMSASLRG